MRRRLPGTENWTDWDRRSTEIQVMATVNVLKSIRGVSYRKLEKTEDEESYVLKFEAKDFGFFYLSYGDCDEDFAKEAKKSWIALLRYVSRNPNIRWADIGFEPSNPLIKTIIHDLSAEIGKKRR